MTKLYKIISSFKRFFFFKSLVRGGYLYLIYLGKPIIINFSAHGSYFKIIICAKFIKIKTHSGRTFVRGFPIMNLWLYLFLLKIKIMNQNSSFSFINFTLYNNHFNKVIYITKEHVEKMSIEFSKLFFFFLPHCLIRII